MWTAILFLIINILSLIINLQIKDKWRVLITKPSLMNFVYSQFGNTISEYLSSGFVDILSVLIGIRLILNPIYQFRLLTLRWRCRLFAGRQLLVKIIIGDLLLSQLWLCIEGRLIKGLRCFLFICVWLLLLVEVLFEIQLLVQVHLFDAH